MIYLDNAATTACAAEVVDAMLPFFRETYGNASSIDHIFGVKARRAVDEAREHVAALVGAKPEEVIFTSGSTEANNLALAVQHRVLTTAVEHPSVLDAFRARQRSDDQLLDIDSNGRVVFDSVETLLDGPPTLIALIATNNETGAEQNLPATTTFARDSGALLHIDATQALLTTTIKVNATTGVDSASISAHKIYGPKGVGALVATSRARRAMRPLAYGGGHERGLRSGTLNVPGIVGFGVAARLATRDRTKRRERLVALRGAFIDALTRTLGPSFSTTLSLENTSPHILSLRANGVNARALLAAVHDEVAFSLGSACATNKAEPSHVLTALGLTKSAISQTFRVSFASDQLESDIAYAATLISEAALRLRDFSLTKSA